MSNELSIKTPLTESLELGELLGARVFLKMETAQPSGSFKNRGIGYFCSHLAHHEKARLFVAASGGNAGLAVAYSGKKLGVPVKVFIPSTSPTMMAEKIRREGAEVIIHGKDIDEAEVLAREHAKDLGSFFISPYDHPLIWKGHSPIIHEIKESGLVPDAIVVSVGGGGLFCGLMQGLHDVGWTNIPIFTAQTEGAASFTKSLQAGRLITLEAITSLATSLGAKTVTSKALEWAKIHPVIAQTVTDRQAVEACLHFADHQRQLVEPACGAALAIIYEKMIDPNKYKNIVVIVCGGCGVSRALLDAWDKRTQ